MGHYANDCPQPDRRNNAPPKPKPAVPGRAYATALQEALANPDVVEGTLLISGVLARVLFDSEPHIVSLLQLLGNGCQWHLLD